MLHRIPIGLRVQTLFNGERGRRVGQCVLAERIMRGVQPAMEIACHVLVIEFLSTLLIPSVIKL
jgi:hypothetical protein